jgi:hypothetical protein
VEAHFKPRTLEHTLKRLCREGGLPILRLTLHRVACRSRAAGAGKSFWALSRMGLTYR